MIGHSAEGLVLQVYRRALTHIMQQALVNEDDKLLLSAHLQVNAMLEQKLIYFSV